MKYQKHIFSILVASFIFLSGCQNQPTPEDQVIGQVGQDLHLGKGVTLFDFQERQMIDEFFEIRGKAPRHWFFEGIIPITLMTLEGDIVSESYGEGAWVEPLEGETELKWTDRISFEAIFEVEPPADADMGKIRIGKSLVAEDDVDEYVEAMILWP